MSRPLRSGWVRRPHVAPERGCPSRSGSHPFGCLNVFQHPQPVVQPLRLGQPRSEQKCFTISFALNKLVLTHDSPAQSHNPWLPAFNHVLRTEINHEKTAHIYTASFHP